MHIQQIIIAIYLLLGFFGYASVGSSGASLEGKKKIPFWRKVLVILLWPLAMIGAI